MLFPEISIHAVKSISQKALFKYWARAAAGKQFPTLSEFRPGERVHDPKQLVFWRVERKDAQLSYRALYQGSHVASAFATDWVGKTLDEITPKFAHYMVMMSANQCAASGDAVYNIFRSRDSSGKAVDCERLLLPLGRSDVVDVVVASMQLVSLEGEADRSTALNQFQLSTELVLAGKLRQNGNREGRSGEPLTSTR